MRINYDCEKSNRLFDYEIQIAIEWLLKIRDKNAHGWAWVQFIAPNGQNTAEVICTLLDNTQYLSEDTYLLLAESCKKWFLNPALSCLNTIDWVWVLMALQKISKNEKMLSLIPGDSLRQASAECINWILNNKNSDGGWSAEKSGLSSTSRTSLALIALQNEVTFVSLPTHEKKISSAIESGVKWLKSNQNADGGWGNIREQDIDRKYQDMIHLHYADLKYQCDSNASCTGYALLALYGSASTSCGKNIYEGVGYLKKTQNSYGGWDVFSEVGIRGGEAGEKYTFRHFSTAWALQSLLYTKNADYRDESVLNGINYLIQLQDNHYGGWKSSLDADNYTWATCNALETIQLVKTQLSEVKAKQFMQIVYDWWNLRKKDGNYSINIFGTIFAFNANSCLLFSIIFTVMMFFIVSSMVDLMSSLFTGNDGESLKGIKLCTGIVLVIGSFLIGLPWVVFVNNVFKKTMNSWMHSFGWVYGIITGFLVAFYQFIL